ncbi:SDR family NAD(P)-dependent oxidoreductase [Sphingomonas sp. DT-204]|uniref:SDR family NAD(P)-dependent oxidoreductase n=1 Tax=Sphingomonas sp. DT-204 TaxID=3396166 RepID=UPI003F1AB234
MADKFAIATGASSGIGLEVARIAAREGYDLLVVADTPLVDAGAEVETVETDLASFEGVDRLLAATRGRRIDLLAANAGRGFVEEDVAAWRHVLDTNITGTVYLLQKVLKTMVVQGQGKVLVTGSIAGSPTNSGSPVPVSCRRRRSPKRTAGSPSPTATIDDPSRWERNDENDQDPGARRGRGGAGPGAGAEGQRLHLYGACRRRRPLRAAVEPAHAALG